MARGKNKKTPEKEVLGPGTRARDFHHLHKGFLTFTRYLHISSTPYADTYWGLFICLFGALPGMPRCGSLAVPLSAL